MILSTIALPFLMLSVKPGSAETLELSRGCLLAHSKESINRYWEVHEAEIDAEAPSFTVPTMFALTGGKKRNVLMRFGSLDLAIPRNKKIIGGKLTLRMADEEHGKLKSVSVIKKPWLTPGIATLVSRMATLPRGGEKPFAPGVTWNSAGGDHANWQSPGAIGSSDREVLNCTIKDAKDKIEIEGLGNVLQNWATHEGSNYGFLLEFEDTCAIWSSTSPEQRPSLSLTLADAEVPVAKSYLTHSGTSVQVHSDQDVASVTIWRGAQKVGTAKQFEFVLPSGSVSKDPRGRLLRVVVEHQIASIPDAVFYLDPTGPWLQTSHDIARRWNRWAVDSSYYSFCTFGAGKYVNAEGPDGAVDPRSVASPRPGFGTNLTDTQLLMSLIPPVRSNDNPVFKQLARPEAGPLTMFEANWIMNGKVGYPNVVLGKLVTPQGLVIPSAKVSVKFGDKVTEVGNTDANGFVVLPKFSDGFVGEFEVTATTAEGSESLVVPSWHFSDQFARGNTKVITIEMPVNLPSVTILREQNLAAGKPVKDSAGSFPAQLAGIADGSDATALSLPSGGWLEFDLGRDRLLAEMVIRGEVAGGLEVKVYGTTEKLAEAVNWIKIDNLAGYLKEYPPTKAGEVALRSVPTGGRYVRITNTGSTAVKIKDISLFAGRR